MELRDATEDDVPPLAHLLELPERAVREMRHRRSVRVAVDDGDVVGVVAFDANADTVLIASLRGPRPALELLLAAPTAFAHREGLAAEMVLPDGRGAVATVLTDAGFTRAGRGPAFQGEETTKYRWEPSDQ